MDATAVRRVLTEAPLALVGDLSQAEDAGGLPRKPGVYAWWVSDGALPEVPAQPHQTATGWSLLYVGISPKDAQSEQTLRSRVLDNHIGGNTGSSTFRYSLAALIGWRPIKKGKKYVLVAEDNTALSEWQRDNLRLSWAVRPRPWEVEAKVIASIEPPLNLDANSGHPFYDTMREARARFRREAVPG